MMRHYIDWDVNGTYYVMYGRIVDGDWVETCRWMIPGTHLED
jgi:hypothetical protein